MISRIPIVNCASASGYAFGFTADSIAGADLVKGHGCTHVHQIVFAKS